MICKNKSYICAVVFFCLIDFRPAYSKQPSSYSALSLDECISLVLSRSPELAIAKTTREQKEALVSSSRKDLFPSLSAQTSYTYKPDTDYYPDNEYGYGLTIEQPIFQGKSIVTGIKQAKLSLNSSQQDIRKTANNLVFNVISLYFSLLKAEKVEEEKHQAVVRLQSHHDDAQAFFKAGLIPLNGVLQTEVELAQGEQNLVDAQNETDIDKARLNILLRRRVDTPLKVKDCGWQDNYDYGWENTLKDAVGNRSIITQARLAVDMAKNDVTLSKAPFLPTVSLSASHNRTLSDAPDAEYYPGWSRDNNSVKAVASWKFWTWKKKSNEVMAAQKNVEKAKLILQQMIDRVTIEARKAYLHYEQASKRIAVAKKVIEHARENFRINHARYKRQVGTTTEVIDAQALLTKAMTNYYDSLFGLEEAKANVMKVRGRLWQKYLNHDYDELFHECNPIHAEYLKKNPKFKQKQPAKKISIRKNINIGKLVLMEKFSSFQEMFSCIF